MTLPPLCFVNAPVLRPDGFSDAPLSVAGERIAASGGRRVDLAGYMVLPGIVDLHGDGFERHLAPRRGAQTDPAAGLHAVDAELAANGITTTLLAQFFSWEGGMRGPGFAERVAEALAGAETLTDMRLQLRLEVNLLDEYERALALVRRAGIGVVTFNDHLPHRHLAEGRTPPRLTGQAIKSGRSPEAHHALLKRLHENSNDVPQALARLAAVLRAEGVILGSHDDSTDADRARAHALGARLAEFPETLAAARAAKADGDSIVMGAPNVVRGGSHDKKVSAEEVIAAGCCDALASDYHYPAPRLAAFALVDRGSMPLAEAWALVSSRPAAVMGWTDRGRLEAGARADLVILDRATRRVAATVAGGQVAHLSGPLAARFL
ncbi:alpha-D-ribose 1-methylphosphonate 5-triphosphate diphosphatase [Rhodobacteraceae bacterium W635]|uniref:alpha-D-ribose 1-methylphosphonate 5-triphosphate diphosphatase n=1 Tax=Nioella halotolerans TaxID=2303578 RepID=UPI000E3B83DA|nr:alpha-D-ribose 1-methylphosphonate 5-triphosphate diphosphatase [Rhodobacteraceae bacterium W635]